MKHIQLFENFILEGYMDNLKEYEKEFKKRGMLRHNDGFDSGGYEDIWYIDFDLGRFATIFTGINQAINNPKTQSKYQEYEYSVYFEPWPQYKTKLFGLIKTKERKLGKLIEFHDGFIDFSEGLFKADDKSFIKKLFKIVDDSLEKAKEISSVEYLSYEESSRWSRPAIDDVDRYDKERRKN